jgi:hypothetical protein
MDNIDHFYINGISTQKMIFLKRNCVIDTVEDRFFTREKPYAHIPIEKISKKYLDRIDEAYDSSIFATFGQHIYEKLVFNSRNSITMNLSKSEEHKHISLKAGILVGSAYFDLHINWISTFIEQQTNKAIIFIKGDKKYEVMMEVLNSGTLPGTEEVIIPDIDGRFEYRCGDNYYVRNKFEYGSNESYNYHVVKFSGDYYVSYHMEENKMLEGV